MQITKERLPLNRNLTHGVITIRVVKVAPSCCCVQNKVRKVSAVLLLPIENSTAPNSGCHKYFCEETKSPGPNEFKVEFLSGWDLIISWDDQRFL